MEIFPLPTVPVDNFVENLAWNAAKARPVGLRSLFPVSGKIRKINEIKALCEVPQAYLSITCMFVGNAFVCISQVLTAIFLL
ncbi:hypothetical protein SAMN05216466_10153 [Paraburkholderia phenazinium]|jgi:hypothetical protein|uniref:Uncharacterized protein n=1 Tax=Paraburkholderia phenazinium TaxID=60549 RepID=A0A1G7NVK2_9BURK|nr:hypothetical protein SAMN05216466_10153 [Paraburkholderia phenazinium]